MQHKVSNQWVYICVCVLWQPLNHSKTRRARTGQRLSLSLSFCFCLSLSLAHSTLPSVYYVLSLSLFLHLLPLHPSTSFHSVQEPCPNPPPPSPCQLFPGEWHKTKVSHWVHVFLAHTRTHSPSVNYNAIMDLMRSLSVSLTRFHVKAS